MEKLEKLKKGRHIPVLRILLLLIFLALVWKVIVFWRFQWYGADGAVRGEVHLHGEEKELSQEELSLAVSVLKEIKAHPGIPELGRSGLPGNVILYGENGISVWNFSFQGDQFWLNFVPYKVPEEYREKLSAISAYELFPQE